MQSQIYAFLAVDKSEWLYITSIVQKVTNIILMGKPGVGKTTLVLKILDLLNREPYGFYTKEIREKGTRVGFELVNLSGERGILSHTNIKSKFRVGKYGVNLDDVERIGVKAIKEGISKGSLVVIDEIAKMELFSVKFKEVVLAALNSKSPVLATIMACSYPYGDRIKLRKDVEIIEVSYANRNTLPDLIKRKIEELL